MCRPLKFEVTNGSNVQETRSINIHHVRDADSDLRKDLAGEARVVASEVAAHIF